MHAEKLQVIQMEIKLQQILGCPQLSEIRSFFLRHRSKAKGYPASSKEEQPVLSQLRICGFSPELTFPKVTRVKVFCCALALYTCWNPVQLCGHDV